MIEPTAIQTQVLHFMYAFLAKEDRLPRTREIATHMGWKSQTAAVSVLVALEKKELIETRKQEGRNTWYRLARKKS